MICAKLLSRLSLRDLFRSPYTFSGELPDRRVHAYRTNLIDARLRLHFADAPRRMFACGLRRSVVCARVYMRRAPSFASAIDTELFYGNEVQSYASDGGWSWIQSNSDGYVGYVPDRALGSVMSSNAIVRVALCLCYRDCRATAESFFTLAMGSRIWVDEDFSRDGFLRTRIDGEVAYISERHIIPLEDLHNRDIDFVSTAEFFMDMPYLYGGGCYAGMDCSALLQTSMALHGLCCPRDADMQEGGSSNLAVRDSDSSWNSFFCEPIGRSLDITNGASVDRAMNNLRRGDLIFWHRHVGIMLDGEHFMHANAGFMCVSRERLADARSRIMDIEGEIRTIRRLERIK